MSRSLRGRLSRALTAALLVLGLIAAVASFFLAFVEAREFQDDTLRQLAILAAPNGADAVPARARQDGLYSDPESRVLVVQLPGTAHPSWLPATLSAGLQTIDAPDQRFRVFVLDRPGGMQTVVMQPTEARDEIAMNSALRTLVPLLLLLPLLVWLIVHIVRREMAPVRRLSAGLDRRPAGQLDPVPDIDLPDELLSFVRAINRLLGRVEQLLGEQRRFIADAAHELRTPLTALSLQIQNLDRADSPQTWAARIAPLRSGIERARRLVDQLLCLARTQAAPAEPSLIDVSGLVRALIADDLPVAESRGIDLGLDEAAGFTLTGSADALRLLIGNGLDNALKFAREGGAVTLRLRREGDSGLIEIIDDGPGLADSERDRVFDPFYRAGNPPRPGSGLGLAIAREAAARLGGELGLHNRDDAPGLVFRYRQSLRP